MTIFLQKTLDRVKSFFHQHGSLYNSIFVFCFLLGLVFVFIVPPFQKPDETTHFYKAVSIASGNLVCHKGTATVFQNPIPKYLADFPAQMFAMHIASSTQNVFPRSLYLSTLFQTSFDQTLVNEPTSCSLPFLLYMLIGTVLFIPVHLGFNPLIIFYLGRLTHFLIAFGLFYLAVRISPKQTKLLPLLILSLPIVLLQISSFSKDALHLSAGVLSFSLFLHFLSEKKKLNIKIMLAFLVSITVMILARPQYILFAFLPLALPFHKLKKTSQQAKILAVLFVLLIFGIVAGSLSLEIYSAKASSLGQEHPNGYVYPELQLQFLAQRPTNFVSIVSLSLERNSNFYLQSAIGVLGWLEFRLPWYISFLYLGFAVFVFLKSREDIPVLSLFQFMTLSAVVFGTFFAIFLSFYLYASPVGSATVLAPQGRYFILLVPYLFLLFASFVYYFQKKFVAVFFVAILLTTFYTLFSRYYLYGRHFYRAVDALPAVNREDSVIVQEPYHEVVPVEAQKKITGYSFFIFKRDKADTKPYQLQILDASCNKVLRSVVVDVSVINYDNWNDITFPALAGTESVCVRLQPYSIEVSETEALQLALQKDKKILAIPLYLY